MLRGARRDDPLRGPEVGPGAPRACAAIALTLLAAFAPAACGEAPAGNAPGSGDPPAAPPESPADPAPPPATEAPRAMEAISASPSRTPFRARRERALGAKPEGLCVADFDGDGLDDLAATTVAPGGLWRWRGTAGGLAREFQREPCGDFPLAPVALPAGSFGASGAARPIALASRTARTLEVRGGEPLSLTLPGTPRALATGRLAIGTAAPIGVLAAACDGGRLAWIQDGAKAAESIAILDDWPRCALFVEELGAVLVGFQGAAAIEAYALPGGAATFRLALPGMPRSMARVDVDGDGDDELAIACGDRGLAIVGANAPGGPRAWGEPRAPLLWDVDAIPLALATADFDGDRRADLAVLHHYQLSALVLSRLAASGPGARHGAYAGQTPVSLAVLDHDGDGRLDVVIANRDTQGLGLLSGDGAGGLEVAGTIALGDFPNALAAAPRRPGTGERGDALRLASVDAKSNTITPVVLADGALRAGTRLASGDEARSPCIAELDGSPGLDLVFLASGPAGTRLMRARGDEHGALVLAPPLDLGGAASSLAVLDLDGPASAGLPALCVSDPSDGSVRLFEPATTFGTASELAGAARLLVPASPRALVPIELDGDPAPELACVLGAPGSRVGVAWLDARRDAGGKLELVELGFTAVGGAPIHAAAADLDGDGDADLALLALAAPGATAGSWMPIVREGGGSSPLALKFTSGPALATGLRPHRIACGDADGDGRAEVFVAAQDSHLVNGWTCELAETTAADGTKTRALAPRAFDDLGAGLGPLDLALVDADLDGHVDLCVANGFSNDLSVLYGRR